MRKYIGTFRVYPEIDLETGKPVDDLYLKCKNNVTIFRYGKDELGILFPSRITLNKMLPEFKKEKIKVLQVSEGDVESIYAFAEKDMEKVAGVLKPFTRGKFVDPMSNKNRLKSPRKGGKK